METVVNGVGVIHIINKFKIKKKSQAFRCIMIYQDKDTGYCFVKPLLYKIDLEIVMELFKIFTSYGAPQVLHINSCTPDMVRSIDNNIRMLCPMFDIEFIRKNGEDNDIAMHVVAKLHKWMEVTNKDEWEIGCCIVQRQINTAKVPGKEWSPQQMFFSGTKYYECNIDDDIEDIEYDEHYTDIPTVQKPSSDNIDDSNEVKEELIEFEEMDMLSKGLGNYITVQETRTALNSDDAESGTTKLEGSDSESEL